MNCVQAEPAWWNGGWQYRRAVTISSTLALTNYDVLVTVNTQTLIAAGTMNPDGSDIMFVDNSNNVLNYWIESGTINTTSTRIWVNVTSIPSGGTTIWMYYGNPSATAQSNGNATFQFFDNTWTSFGNPVFSEVGAEEWESSYVSEPNVFQEGSTYYMLYDGHTSINQKGLATSTNLITWTRSPYNPVVTYSGVPGSWDQTGVAWGDTVLVGSTYYMLVAGLSASGQWTIGVETSTNLTTWNDNPPGVTNPVLVASAPWEGGSGGSLSGDAVLKALDGITPVLGPDGNYWMAYHDYASPYQIGLAYSSNLLSWTKYSGNPILSATNSSWESGGLWVNSFVEYDGTYYIFFYGTTGGQNFHIGYAWSNAATEFPAIWHQTQNYILPYGAAGSWDSSDMEDPVIREFNGTFYLFYSAKGTVYANGFATASNITGPFTEYAGSWTNIGAESVTGGVLDLPAGGGPNEAGVQSVVSYSPGVALGYSADFEGSSNSYKWGGFLTPPNNYPFTYIGTVNSVDNPDLVLTNYVSGRASADLGSIANAFHVYELDWLPNETIAYIDHSSTPAGEVTSQVPTGPLPIQFENYNDPTYPLLVNWVYVRPYSNPEPTTSVGSEETLSYTLTVSVSPVGSGSVALNASAPYYYGDVVSLTATPSAGWSFSSWSGDLTGSANPATLTITGNMSVTATFTQNVYTLTVTVSPVGSGSVTLNNTGPYQYGDVVQLTAVPATGWSFSSWSGDLTGSANPATLTITGNMSVTAYFTFPQIYIDPSSIQKGPGDTYTTFQANVMVETISDLQGFEFNVTWDNNLIALVSVDYTTTLNNMWGSGNWYIANNATGSGYYDLAAVCTSTSFTGAAPTPLATLTFIVEAAVGQTSIHFALVKLNNSQAESIQAQVTDGTYQITGPQYLPVLQISPDNVTCRKYGEYFTVQMNVTNAITLDGFNFTIYYNATLISYVNVSWGALGSGTVTYVDQANGILEGYVAGTAISGNCWLLNVTFQDIATLIWKEGQVNELDGQVGLNYAQLSFSGVQQLAYQEGGVSQVSVNNVAFAFVPIQGDVNNDGVVNIFDLRTVAAYFDVKEGDPLWAVASAYDLRGDGIIDIFDLVLIAANFGFSYP
jgi:hypothetical protein